MEEVPKMKEYRRRMSILESQLREVVDGIQCYEQKVKRLRDDSYDYGTEEDDETLEEFEEAEYQVTADLNIAENTLYRLRREKEELLEQIASLRPY